MGEDMMRLVTSKSVFVCIFFLYVVRIWVRQIKLLQMAMENPDPLSLAQIRSISLSLSLSHTHTHQMGREGRKRLR